MQCEFSSDIELQRFSKQMSSNDLIQTLNACDRTANALPLLNSAYNGQFNINGNWKELKKSSKDELTANDQVKWLTQLLSIIIAGHTILGSRYTMRVCSITKECAKKNGKFLHMNWNLFGAFNRANLTLVDFISLYKCVKWTLYTTIYSVQ